MNLVVHHQQIRVPSRGPSNVALFIQNVVRKNNLRAFLYNLRRQPVRHVLHPPRITRRQRWRNIVPWLLEFVFHRKRFHLEPDDSRQIRLLVLVIQNRKPQVVVQKTLLLAALFHARFKPNRIPSLVSLPLHGLAFPVLRRSYFHHRHR